MLKLINADLLNELTDGEVVADTVFLRATAKAIKAELLCYVYEKNNQINVVLFLFRRNNRIVLPRFQIFYSFIWHKHSLSEQAIRDALFYAVKSLTEKYREIEIMLPVDFEDVRPFIWNNFSVKLRYTYLKQTSGYQNIKRDAKKNYSRACSRNYQFNTVGFKTFNWGDHRKHLLEFGCSNKRIAEYFQWFTILDKEELLLCFQVRERDELRGSGILVLNKFTRTAYFILRLIPKNQFKKEINAFVSIEVLKRLNANGIDTLDDMGANMRSIADFKAKYKPILKPYYVVKYIKNKFDLYNNLKYLVRKILIKIYGW